MEYPIVALVENECNEDLCWCSKDGRLFPNELNCYDLFFAPEKHEGWINIFNGVLCGTHASCGIYESKEAAEKLGNSLSGYITTIKIEWED